ncbi:helix-turn-helix domain-containing protein [Methylocapsa sp. S129]|uniref:helix-turn-helix domain-containing protein n=1 Tax=Methylocapsa sp. S129 TaxID=1641869 RepID=UPI00131B1E29|nr:helix-turn-helix domain-containing protein [Methylocapsa sp. S129]
MIELGATLRRLRETAGLTLSLAAKRADVTKGYLSKVELGSAVPSIAVVSRLADVYGIGVSDIFITQGERTSLSIVRADERAPINRNGTELGYTYELASRRMLNPRAEAFFLTLPVLGHEQEPPQFKHSGEEIIVMLEGRMKFEYGGAEIILGPGDCIHFQANIEHHGVAMDGDPARAFVVVVPDRTKSASAKDKGRSKP